MAVNKVTLNGVTEIDTSGVTVEEENLLAGFTALKNDGTLVTGTATGGGEDVTDIRIKLDALSESTSNIFNPIAALKGSTGITYKDGVFVGTTNDFRTFVLLPHEDVEVDTFTISFDTYTEQNATSSNTGLGVYVKNSSDGNVTYNAIPNSTSTWTHFSYTYTFTSAVYYVRFGYATTASLENVWHVKNIHIEKASSESSYISPYSAIDTQARGSVASKITAPSSPTSGQFLMWDGNAWVAASLPLYNGGVS